ncbi:MAG: hypothetical protein JWP82_1749, partial [Humibacillus sp.]|nr:hypothetical protein [Humibacillus sp.]
LEHTQPALAQPDAVRAAQSRAAQALDEMVAELTDLTEPTGRTRQAVRGSTA